MSLPCPQPVDVSRFGRPKTHSKTRPCRANRTVPNVSGFGPPDSGHGPGRVAGAAEALKRTKPSDLPWRGKRNCPKDPGKVKRNKCIASSNKCIATSNKKLLVTSEGLFLVYQSCDMFKVRKKIELFW